MIYQIGISDAIERRFWKSENDTDKKAAYHTLYHVLLTSVKVIAPILPFMSEKSIRIWFVIWMIIT